jgi:hypothetical protein
MPGFTATQLRTALEPAGSPVKLRTCRRTGGASPRPHPTLQLNHLARSDAVTALLRRYLAAFGRPPSRTSSGGSA